MKKILIISAIITGCIAPAIFAATQYISYTPSAPKNENSAEVKQAKKVNDPVKLCLQWVISEYNKEKRKASVTYKKSISSLVQSKDKWNTVSWEKSVRLEKMQIFQNEYRASLLALKEKYSAKQQLCTKK
jgi:hypothetical protein